MRRNNLLVFDDFIPTPVTGSAIVCFTPAELNDKLGKFDQLAIMVIIDNLNGHVDGFDLWLAHSADARLWMYRSLNQFGKPGAGTGDVTWAAAGGLDETTTNVHAYLDSGSPSLLTFVRLEMNFSGTSTKGHVRVYVTQRDQGA